MQYVLMCTRLSKQSLTWNSWPYWSYQHSNLEWGRNVLTDRYTVILGDAVSLIVPRCRMFHWWIVLIPARKVRYFCVPVTLCSCRETYLIVIAVSWCAFSFFSFSFFLFLHPFFFLNFSSICEHPIPWLPYTLVFRVLVVNMGFF